jgi:hypothetical protein
MNCSGNHAAMLATCVQRGWPMAGYQAAEHELQRLIAGVIPELTGEPIAAAGMDGCGLPLAAFSLTGLARARSAGWSPAPTAPRGASPTPCGRIRGWWRAPVAWTPC